MNAIVDQRRIRLAQEIDWQRRHTNLVSDDVWALVERLNGKLNPPFDNLALSAIFDEEMRRPLEDLKEAQFRREVETRAANDSRRPSDSEPLDPKALGWLALMFQGTDLRKQGSTYIEVHAALSELNRQRPAPYSDDVVAKLAVTAMGSRAYPNTEAGDAEFFAALHAENVRYDHGRGRWLELDAETGIWVPDGVERLHQLALDMMRRRQRNAVIFVTDPEEKKKAANWAFAGESVRRLDNTLRLARTMPPIADAGDGWDPDPYLMGALNGVVDLRTGELRMGRPEDRVTMRVSVPYDPAATCPLWEQTVSVIFDGDESLIGFVHRASGYSITGDCREECLFLMHGLGGNGKGTFINTVSWVSGDYSDDVPFSTLERHERSGIPADVAKLVGKRVVTASESGGARELNVERIKALTGRDPITARFLHKNFFTFQPVAKFWLSSNEKPVVRDDSEGFWRRVHLIPFEQSFVGHADVTLKDRLKAEAPGILAWLVRGALAWQRDGLNPPHLVRAATAQYRQENDPLAAFIDECCVVAEGANVQSSRLFTGYSEWADDCGLKPWQRLSQTAFGLQMTKRFDKGRPAGTVVYAGIGLREKYRGDL